MITSDLFASRLTLLLRDHRVSVAERHISDVCVEDFSLLDFLVADRLLSGPSPCQPWCISLGDAAGALSSRIEFQACGHDFASTLAALLHGLDEARTTVHSVEPLREGLQLLSSRGQLIAALGPVTEAVAPPELTRRAERALKGVGDMERDRLAPRLAALPGVSVVAERERRGVQLSTIPGGGPLIGEPLLKTPSSWASAFRASVKRRCDIDLTQAQAQEMLASCFGWSSWHHLCADGKDVRVLEQAHYLVSNDEATFCRDAAVATALFSLALSQNPGRYDEIIDFSGHLRAIDSRSGGALAVEPVPVVDEPSEEYLKAASLVAEVAAVDRPMALAAALGVGGSVSARIRGITQRRPGMITLSVRDWRFSLETIAGRQRMRAERDADDRPGADTGWVACYKAGLSVVPGGVELLSDYSRNVEAVFSGFGEDEARQIAEFSGIQVRLPMGTWRH